MMGLRGAEISLQVMNPQKYVSPKAFQLECGNVLPNLEITYHTFGKLNSSRDNVIWAFHALTANSDVNDWWHGLFGREQILDPNKYFIVCANILGSCYGSSGPTSFSPDTKTLYHTSFPPITIRDMVNAHHLLCAHLNIDSIKLGIGGSMGGYQLLEWTVQQPGLFDNLCLLATSARASAWEIAVHEAQRMAIESDPTWKNCTDNAGSQGLKAARAIGMLTYRSYSAFELTQHEEEPEMFDHRAASYMRYQGEKLANRFSAQSYHLLSKAMDSHNLSRGRRSLKEVLNEITSPTLVIGINSDNLCPLGEQEFLAEYIPKASLKIIDSPYGHDGFLVETDLIGTHISNWLKG